MCKHIKLVLPNVPGEAANVVSIISGSKDPQINILGYSLSDHGDSGVICLLCTDHDKAFLLLKDKYKNFVKEQNVLIVSVPHYPGTLLPILKALADKEINVRSSYQAFESEKDVLIVLSFNDDLAIKMATKVLKTKKANIITEQP